MPDSPSQPMKPERILVIWRHEGRNFYREVDAFDALTDVLVDYDVPSGKIVAEFRKLLLHPEYESADRDAP